MPREPSSRDRTTLLDIQIAATRIQRFIGGVDGVEAFQSDLKTQSAVLHQLLVIGEAAKRISQDFRAAHPELPWSRMTGMRDRLIHGYDDVDLVEVWRTSTQDVERLIDQIEPLLSRSKDS